MAQVPGSESPTRTASPEAVQRSLERILGSSQFRGSPRLAEFLRFIVKESLDGRRGDLKETVIAEQVFGRRPDFDPRMDSVVRVEATNLRKRLREYYLEEGADDEVRIEVPRGGYVPVFLPSEPLPPERPWWRRHLWIAAAVLAAVPLAILHYAIWRDRQQPPASVAVMGFMNLSSSEDDARIAEQLAVDLATMLAQAPGLRVVSRASAFPFRGARRDARKIGRRLGVASVLEGSLRREGGGFRVTVKLVSARSGYHLWSGSFDRDPAGMDLLPEVIAREVTRALGVEQPIRGARAATRK
jgi:adenylate cyclase